MGRLANFDATSRQGSTIGCFKSQPCVSSANFPRSLRRLFQETRFSLEYLCLLCGRGQFAGKHKGPPQHKCKRSDHHSGVSPFPGLWIEINETKDKYTA